MRATINQCHKGSMKTEVQKETATHAEAKNSEQLWELSIDLKGFAESTSGH